MMGMVVLFVIIWAFWLTRTIFCRIELMWGGSDLLTFAIPKIARIKTVMITTHRIAGGMINRIRPIEDQVCDMDPFVPDFRVKKIPVPNARRLMSPKGKYILPKVCRRCI